MAGADITKVVCIVGMHRSGTSCLAGSLQEAGLHLGDVITAAPNNRKGTRENMRITALNDAVLVYNGGSWMQPPRHVIWSDVHRAERDAIIASYADTTTWGFKDPRTVLLADFWRERLANIRLVGTLRHPCSVAESLLRRNGRSIEYWIDLWADYNERVRVLYEADPFPIVHFGVGETAYRRSLTLVMAYLGLNAPAHPTFFDPDLRHHEISSGVELPKRVSNLYEELCDLALNP